MSLRLTFSGCLDGSSFLNEDFRTNMRRRLMGERPDIEQNGSTLESIVEHAILEFEGPMKRTLDVTKNVEVKKDIRVPGLKGDMSRRFRDNYIEFHLYVCYSTRFLMDTDKTSVDFREIFVPHLLQIERLMEEQLKEAKKAGHKVEVWNCCPASK